MLRKDKALLESLTKKYGKNTIKELIVENSTNNQFEMEIAHLSNEEMRELTREIIIKYDDYTEEIFRKLMSIYKITNDAIIKRYVRTIVEEEFLSGNTTSKITLERIRKNIW